MRCKNHPVDLSSSVGVCASCLRERLLYLVAAQAQAQAQNRAQAHPQSQPHQQPPLVFPRSVSPYVSRRKSDDTENWNRSHHRRFHSTPQVGNTIGCFAPTKKHRKFSILSYLFRSRSKKFDSDPSPVHSDPRTSDSPHRGESRTSSSSPYWSSIFPGRPKAPTSRSSMDDGNHPRRPPVSGRGMSPTERSDSDPDCENTCSPSRSGYSSTWRSTPTSDIGKRTRPRGVGKNMSSLAFCLSPLVRASPSRQWKHKGGPSNESMFSGEMRTPAKPHISTAARYCANRSRKLADFGRPARTGDRTNR